MYYTGGGDFNAYQFSSKNISKLFGLGSDISPYVEFVFKRYMITLGNENEKYLKNEYMQDGKYID